MTTTSARAGRRLLAGAALVLAAVTTGCASAASSSTTSPAAPATATTGAQSTPAQPTASATASGAAATATPSAGGTTAGPNAVGTPACSSRYLRADAGVSQGAAGSIYQVITFTNLNNTACTLYGYPGVALANGTPVTQVGAAADRMPGSTKITVTLAPHGIASATLRIVDALNFPSAQCKPVATTWIQVYPPNQTVPLFVGYKSTACSNSSVHTLTIDVVKPGNGG